MTEFRPVKEKSEQEALAARFDVPYAQRALAYVALCEGRSVGLCQFFCDGETLRLHSIGTVRKGGDRIAHTLAVSVYAFALRQGCRSLSCERLPAHLQKILRSLAVFQSEQGKNW